LHAQASHHPQRHRARPNPLESRYRLNTVAGARCLQTIDIGRTRRLAVRTPVRPQRLGQCRPRGKPSSRTIHDNNSMWPSALMRCELPLLRHYLTRKCTRVRTHVPTTLVHFWITRAVEGQDLRRAPQRHRQTQRLSFHGLRQPVFLSSPRVARTRSPFLTKLWRDGSASHDERGRL
jgi:hypothetical protein